MKRTLLPSLVLLSLFISCKKKEASTDVELDVTLANVAGSYKITAAKLTTLGTTQDIYNDPMYFDLCEKDDIIRFTTSGTYTITDLGTMCNPPNNDAGVYSVNTTAKTITVDGETGNVKSLTATKLIVEQTMGTGVSASSITVTYTKQ